MRELKLYRYKPPSARQRLEFFAGWVLVLGALIIFALGDGSVLLGVFTVLLVAVLVSVGRAHLRMMRRSRDGRVRPDRRDSLR